MVREGRDFPEVEAKLPELIEEMRTDLCSKPLTSEFISLSNGVSYNAGPIPFFTFYIEEHDELMAKLQVCEQYGAIYDVRRNQVPRWNLAEDSQSTRWGGKPTTPNPLGCPFPFGRFRLFS